MLVLSRDVGERIIAGDVTITLVGVRSSTRARIGIDAASDVPIHRQEIFDRIIRERGPFLETRRVPVELLRRIANVLARAGDDGATELAELAKLLNTSY